MALEPVTRPGLTSFVVTSAVLVTLNLSAPDRAMYGDAANYWTLGQTFVADGRFSLLDYRDVLRGYSLPLVLCGLQQIAHVAHLDPVTVFRVVSAMLGAALISLVLPAFLMNSFGGVVAVSGRLIFSALAVLYWHGHLLYSLSDIPALLLLVTGLSLLPATPGQRTSVWRSGAAGACFALAANMRAVYEVALLAAAGLMLWHVSVALRSHRESGVVATIVSFACGAALVLWPQSMINREVQGTPNPFAHGSPDSRRPNLYVQQLAWGVAIQRYETNIGPGFPPALMFLDARGIDLLHIDAAEDPRVSLTRARLSVRAYLRMLAAQPIFFAELYARHLFNGLDVAYATPYVTRVVPRSIPFAFVNYLVLSLAIVGGIPALLRLRVGALAWPAARLAVFLLPAVVAIPTAVETRFFLAPWLTAYGFVVFRLLASDQRSAFVRSSWLAAPVLVMILGAFALASSTYAQIANAPPDFVRWCFWC